ncbi:helix-turn-helix domain-containing protein [Enterococcus sp. 2201sp1_2201st1_B8_2201SCRN_220225]|uniref:helix-turn-helix domain-containing protein n=1 Tax=unclassified Enterococcus TaxID=2608891 RepID=UPI0034A5943B
MRRSLTETFWVNMERYQELRGLDDKQIAQHLGIRRDSWREYRSMKQSPKLQRVEKLAKILRVKPIDLLESWTEKEWREVFEKG